MRVLLATLLIGLFTGTVFGYGSGPDPASNGVFGQATCNVAGCHVGNPVNSTSGNGSLTLSGLPSAWTPGQTYPLTVTISRTGSGRYGFQLSAVADSGNTQAGTLASTSNRVSVISGGGVQFSQHNQTSSALAPTGIFTINWTAPANASVGSVRFNLAANAANGDSTNAGDFIYTRVDKVSASSAPPPPPVIQTFYYPQIADGSQTNGVFWKSTIFLYNPSATDTAIGTVTFAKSNGASFPIAFLNEAGQPANSGNTISFNLGPGMTRKYVSSAGQALEVGFATVTSSAIITGTAIFSEFAPNGQLLGEAGVPAGGAVTRQAIFVDRSGGFNTGVAYANPGSTTASITLQLLDANGVAVLPASTLNLGPGEHRAAYIGLAGQLFPTAPAFTGTMQIASNVPLTVIALRFDPTFALFTTLPPVPLP